MLAAQLHKDAQQLIKRAEILRLRARETAVNSCMPHCASACACVHVPGPRPCLSACAVSTSPVLLSPPTSSTPNHFSVCATAFLWLLSPSSRCLVSVRVASFRSPCDASIHARTVQLLGPRTGSTTGRAWTHYRWTAQGQPGQPQGSSS